MPTTSLRHIVKGEKQPGHNAVPRSSVSKSPFSLYHALSAISVFGRHVPAQFLLASTYTPLMDKPRINAHIQEVGSAGAYYPVRLTWTPQRGELIELTSFTEGAAGSPAMHWYEVVQIVHELHDVHDGEEKTYGEDHFVRVLVRPVPNDMIRAATLGQENAETDASELVVGANFAQGTGTSLLGDGENPLLN